MPQHRRQVNHLGYRLVEGPVAIFPPENIDDFGWLEPGLTLQWRDADWHHISSTAVFSDSTMNRTRGFLDPVIRVVTWDRRASIQGPSPSLVYHHLLGHARDWNTVRGIARRLQAAMRSLPFAVYGLSRTRRSARVEADPRWGEFSLKIGNGIQFAEFHSPALAEDALTDHVRTALTELRDQVERIDASGWRERYHDPPGPNGVFDWTIGTALDA